MDFWTAEQLREEFDTLASFYQVKLGNQLVLCRNHAVIIRKGFAVQEQPDTVVVMANPGSCSPKDPSYQPPIVKNDLINIPYVRVNNDPTQYQLMRLMKVMNWNVISILNLSDLCSGNDVVIVIGTSLEVYPASQLPNMFDGKTVYINTEINGQNPNFDLIIKGKAGEILRQVNELI